MNFATRAYYTFKPFIPRVVRDRMRRVHARRIFEGATKKWPIDPAAMTPPKNWSGWPEGKKFAVVLTHDVEWQKGYDRIKKLVALETEMGFRSSFNLIPEGPYSVEKSLRDKLVADGFEVGVHDLNHDGKMYRSRSEFQTEESEDAEKGA